MSSSACFDCTDNDDVPHCRRAVQWQVPLLLLARGCACLVVRDCDRGASILPACFSCTADGKMTDSVRWAQCHDSVLCPRPKEVGAVETHADSTMLQDMKVMIGSIQDAFVSIWVVDVNQLRPFSSTGTGTSSTRSRVEPSRPPAPSAPAQSQVPQSNSRPPSANYHLQQQQQPLVRNTPSAVSSERLAPEFQSRVAVSTRPVTPATAAAAFLPRPSSSSSSAPGTANTVRVSDDPRLSRTSRLRVLMCGASYQLHVSQHTTDDHCAVRHWMFTGDARMPTPDMSALAAGSRPGSSNNNSGAGGMCCSL